MATFIRVAEVWTPTADGTLLQLAGGLFDAAPRFGAISRSLCFGRAEGLPGHAWDEGHPLMLRQLEGSYFRRSTAARVDGLTCAIALPIFVEERLTSVVVLLCGAGDEQVGAIELWHNDQRISSDLTLADGYYGASPPALEELTRDSWLPSGSGAPGLAWQRDAAVFIDSLPESRHFLRTQAAASAGIVRALALPCTVRLPMRETWIISLLSSRSTPIARRVESWLPNEGGATMRRAFGYCEALGGLNSEAYASVPVETLGPVGLAYRTAAAQAVPETAAHGALTPEEAGAAGLNCVLTVPLIAGSLVSEVIALYF